MLANEGLPTGWSYDGDENGGQIVIPQNQEQSDVSYNVMIEAICGGNIVSSRTCRIDLSGNHNSEDPNQGGGNSGSGESCHQCNELSQSKEFTFHFSDDDIVQELSLASCSEGTAVYKKVVGKKCEYKVTLNGHRDENNGNWTYYDFYAQIGTIDFFSEDEDYENVVSFQNRQVSVNYDSQCTIIEDNKIPTEFYCNRSKEGICEEESEPEPCISKEEMPESFNVKVNVTFLKQGSSENCQSCGFTKTLTLTNDNVNGDFVQYSGSYGDSNSDETISLVAEFTNSGRVSFGGSAGKKKNGVLYGGSSSYIPPLQSSCPSLPAYYNPALLEETTLQMTVNSQECPCDSSGDNPSGDDQNGSESPTECFKFEDWKCDDPSNPETTMVSLDWSVVCNGFGVPVLGGTDKFYVSAGCDGEGGFTSPVMLSSKLGIQGENESFSGDATLNLLFHEGGMVEGQAEITYTCKEDNTIRTDIIDLGQIVSSDTQPPHCYTNPSSVEIGNVDVSSIFACFKKEPPCTVSANELPEKKTFTFNYGCRNKNTETKELNLVKVDSGGYSFSLEESGTTYKVDVNSYEVTASVVTQEATFEARTGFNSFVCEGSSGNYVAIERVPTEFDLECPCSSLKSASEMPNSITVEYSSNCPIVGNGITVMTKGENDGDGLWYVSEKIKSNGVGLFRICAEDAYDPKYAEFHWDTNNDELDCDYLEEKIQNQEILEVKDNNGTCLFLSFQPEENSTFSRRFTQNDCNINIGELNGEPSIFATEEKRYIPWISEKVIINTKVVLRCRNPIDSSIVNDKKWDATLILNFG